MAVNGNPTAEGAGTYNAGASTLTITNSTFSGNAAADYGRRKLQPRDTADH